jgi:hypothetical protein
VPLIDLAMFALLFMLSDLFSAKSSPFKNISTKIERIILEEWQEIFHFD